MGKPWLQILTPLEELIQWEALIIVWIFVGLSWGIQKLFLKRLTEERRRLLATRFKNLNRQIISFSVLFVIFYILHTLRENEIIYRLLPYIGFFTVVAGAITFIQICRIILLQYLFLTSDKTAVPILLVNIFTLGLTIFIVGWLTTEIFGIKVAPLLATSAVFSIILGLALQDTLGNLFAGISLQIDHSFEIGDWVEITQSSQKISGQVLEITWRSTVLVGFLDELISIPNRFVAQSQINNWSRNETPIARSQTFRIPYTANLEQVKRILGQSLIPINRVCKTPKPIVLVSEPAESWVLVKVIYYIKDYGTFATVADEVIHECIKSLAHENIKVAHQKIDLETTGEHFFKTPYI